MDKLLLVLMTVVFLDTSCGSIRDTPVPDSLVYVKLVNIEEVYDSADFEKFVRYKVASDTFTAKERDILINMLIKNNQHFIIDTDSSIYLPKSAVYNLEAILSLNEEVYKKVKSLGR